MIYSGFGDINQRVLELADVSEHLACSIIWVEVIKENHHFDPDDGIDKMFRNVGQQI
jgi:hypothetical protein